MKTALSKTISITLAGVLFFTNCLFVHATETNLWFERQKSLQKNKWNPASAPLFASLPVPVPQPFIPTLQRQVVKTFIPNLPLQYGTLRKVLNPKSPNPKSKIIIHIQDVHMNQEAQKNIGAALQELINQKKVDLIALEGAFAPIDLTAFRTFPHHDTIQKVADYLLRENKISGPIHTAFTSPAEIPAIVGIDDRAHYNANVEAYRQSAPLIKPTKEKLENQKKELRKKKLSAFSTQLAALDEKVEAYREGKLSLGEYVTFLQNNVPSPLVGEGRVRGAVDVFLEALKFESSLNFSQVEAERTQLLNHLLPKLTKEQTMDLVNQSVAYRLGQISHTDFYDFLKRTCEKNGIHFDRYPAMKNYLHYILLSDQIDAEKLFEDVKKMEEEAFASFAGTNEERDIIKESKWVYLTGKLLDFALTREEWMEYKSVIPAKAGIQVSNIPQKIVYDLDSRFRGNDDLKPFEAFYAEAEARDQAMSGNLLKAMDERHAKVAVLVTGGFHSNGISQLAHDSGLTTISFVPKITKVDSQNGSAYLSVFAQGKTPLEKLVQGEKLFLAFQTALPIEDGQVSLLARALDPAAKILVPNRFEITDVEHTEHHHDIKVTNKGSGLREEITAEDYLDEPLNVSVRLIGVSVASILLSILTWMVLDQIGWGVAANFVAVIVGIIALFIFGRWQGLQPPIAFGEIQLINGLKITVPVWRGWLAEPMYMAKTGDEDEGELEEFMAREREGRQAAFESDVAESIRERKGQIGRTRRSPPTEKSPRLQLGGKQLQILKNLKTRADNEEPPLTSKQYWDLYVKWTRRTSTSRPASVSVVTSLMTSLVERGYVERIVRGRGGYLWQLTENGRQVVRGISETPPSAPGATLYLLLSLLSLGRVGKIIAAIPSLALVYVGESKIIQHSLQGGIGGEFALVALGFLVIHLALIVAGYFLKPAAERGPPLRRLLRSSLIGYFFILSAYALAVYTQTPYLGLLFQLFFDTVVIAWDVVKGVPLRANPNLKPTVEYLKHNQISNPERFIVEKFMENRIVGIGDNHWEWAPKSFTAKLVPQLYKAGVRYITIEMWNQLQNDLDLYMKTGRASNELIQNVSFKMMRHIIDAARTHPEMRVIAFDPREPASYQLYTQDTEMAGHIEKILRDDPQAKILVFAGSHHIGSDKTQVPGDAKRLGTFLREMTQNKAYLIDAAIRFHARYNPWIDEAITQARLSNDNFLVEPKGPLASIPINEFGDSISNHFDAILHLKPKPWPFVFYPSDKIASVYIRILFYDKDGYVSPRKIVFLVGTIVML